MQRLRNIIRSRSETGFSFGKVDDNNVDIKKSWENIRQNIIISAKESIGHYELSRINHGLTKDVQKY
jgi:hypothetical protein